MIIAIRIVRMRFFVASSSLQPSRDIKCANILVASDGTVKLADFGLAKATRLNDLMSCKGTAFWMAPEVIYHKSQGYGRAADIWSLGCTVLEMLTRNIPYHPLEFQQALYSIGKGELPPIPAYLSADARDFIQQCLRVDANDRPTAAELLGHNLSKDHLLLHSVQSLLCCLAIKVGLSVPVVCLWLVRLLLNDAWDCVLSLSRVCNFHNLKRLIQGQGKLNEIRKERMPVRVLSSSRYGQIISDPGR